MWLLPLWLQSHYLHLQVNLAPFISKFWMLFYCQLYGNSIHCHNLLENGLQEVIELPTDVYELSDRFSNYLQCFCCFHEYSNICPVYRKKQYAKQNKIFVIRNYYQIITAIIANQPVTLLHNFQTSFSMCSSEISSKTGS